MREYEVEVIKRLPQEILYDLSLGQGMT